MSELISRSYLKKELSKSPTIRDFERNYDGMIFDILNKAPSVDLWRNVEFKADGSTLITFRPKGKWIDDNGDDRCPYCNVLRDSIYGSFCPNCGSMLAEIGPEDSDNVSTD